MACSLLIDAINAATTTTHPTSWKAMTNELNWNSSGPQLICGRIWLKTQGSGVGLGLGNTDKALSFPHPCSSLQRSDLTAKTRAIGKWDEGLCFDSSENQATRNANDALANYLTFWCDALEVNPPLRFDPTVPGHHRRYRGDQYQCADDGRAAYCWGDSEMN